VIGIAPDRAIATGVNREPSGLFWHYELSVGYELACTELIRSRG
jgi:hypothetical protein